MFTSLYLSTMIWKRLIIESREEGLGTTVILISLLAINNTKKQRKRSTVILGARVGSMVYTSID